MRVVFFLLVIAHITLASLDWEQFKIKYRKIYKNQEEEDYRKNIFLEKLHLIEEHNKKYQELYTYKVKINKFADMTEDEMFPYKKPIQQSIVNPANKLSSYKISSTEVPESIDWRDYGVVSPIADQQVCETCWAFAIVGTIEAHWAIYNGENVSLSQQNLADCVDPTFTCNTDLQRDMLERTYQYIIDNGGIDTLESYPYEYYTVGECRFSDENVGAKIRGYANITEGDEEELKKIVGTVGPVTVAIATNTMWTIYGSGIFYDESCTEDQFLNHAVIVVGYGNENGEDYWLVKNSWGTWYGQEGYIKMARNRGNLCGIASVARYPLI